MTLGKLLCSIGWHDYRWHGAMHKPRARQFSWEQCERCGKVNPEHLDEYRAYHNPDYDA